MDDNFTSIQDLIKSLHKEPIKVSYGPEREPPKAKNEGLSISESVEHTEIHESSEAPKNDDVTTYVNDSSDQIELDDELKSLGAEVPEEHNHSSILEIEMPLKDEAILQGKKKPMNTSIRWLAEFCLYYMHRAHIQLKNIHGKVKRVYLP